MLRWVLSWAGWVAGAIPPMAAVAFAAAEPLAPVTPLLGPVRPAPIGADATLAAAQRAHDLGVLTAAVDLYRELLTRPDVDRREVGLALATVLLDADRAVEARAVLAGLPEPNGSAWELRAGLAALQMRERDAAQAHWDATRVDDLSAADRPWYWFLAGALYDLAPVREISRANENYSRAEREAPTDLARARFQLAAEVVRLRMHGTASEADLRQAREDYERFPGRTIGYDRGKAYAVMLAESGRQAEAIAFLNRVLSVPPAERVVRDELNFVLGMVGDRGRHPDGRAALTRLLESGGNPVRQRQALQLLAEASQVDPERGQFRALLRRLVELRPPHPVRESLLLHRAQLALADKDYAQAEKDAMELRDDFPGSPLRVHAFGVLLQSAWEQRRYRLAADNARRAREALAGLPDRGAGDEADLGLGASPLFARSRAQAELGIVEAEAAFRAGDFRPAADAYAAVLRERPTHLGPARLGELMYMYVLAEIRSGSGAAPQLIDQLEEDPAFGLENRWQTEWSLTRALQLEGKTAEAYGRVTRLLGLPADGSRIRPELRARMAWLQAELSFDARQFQETLALVGQLAATVAAVPEPLRTEIASMGVLLKARAEFQLGQEAAALETGRRLRAEYPLAEAAVQSFLVEADHFAAQDKIDQARLRLTDLVDNEGYKNSPHVPYALFHLAVLSERLGQPNHLEEANKRIEDLVKMPAAAGETDLIFAARLKQGDLFRKMNRFPQAQQAYEDLVNKYPRRPDIVLAQLALAQCHNAQSAGDPPDAQSHANLAQLKFEELRDRVDAPRDVRVEAGYNLGALLARRGKREEAVKVWWRDVVRPFLLEEQQPIDPGVKRRYWLGRTLLDLGELLERLGRPEEAKSAYELVLRKQVGYGHTIAQNALQRLGVVAGKP